MSFAGQTTPSDLSHINVVPCTVRNKKGALVNTFMMSRIRNGKHLVEVWPAVAIDGYHCGTSPKSIKLQQKSGLPVNAGMKVHKYLVRTGGPGELLAIYIATNAVVMEVDSTGHSIR
jgi:hypothetical protein